MARGKKGTGKGYVHISGQRGGASKLQNQGRDSVSLEPASSEAAQPSSPLGGESEAPIGAPSTETAQGKGKGKAKAREKSPPLASEDDESDSQAEAKVKPKKKTGPKPKPASEGMKIAATKSASVVFLDPDDEDDALILGDKQRCVSPSTIEASDHLKNWKLWASVKDDLRLKNLVDATKHSMFPARLDSMIQRGAPSGTWALKSVQWVRQNRLRLPKKMTWPPQTGCWAAEYEDTSVTTQLQPLDRTALIYGSLVDEDDSDRAAGVANNILDFLNAAPLPKVNLRPTDQLGQMIIITTLAKYDAEVQGKPMTNLGQYIVREVIKQQGGFKLHWLKDKKRWEVVFQLFDRNMEVITGQRRIVLNPKDVTLSNQAPSLPTNVSQQVELEHSPHWGDIDRAALTDEEQAQHQACRRLARHVQFVMFGACGDKMSLLTQANGIASVYRSSESTRTQTATLANLYHGKKMLLTDGKSRNNSSLIRLTNPVKVDVLNGTVPDIVVVGKAKDRISVPLETMYQKFMSGSNVLDMWQEGCIAADRVNRLPAGTMLRNPCDHQGDERLCKLHVCQSCEGLDFCDHMVYSKYTDLRVDRECEHKTDSTYHKYKDGLMEGTRKEAPEKPSDTRTSPFRVDAEVCFWVDKDGKTWYHHEDACVVTAQYANYATNTWLKGNLLLGAEAVDFKDKDLSAYEDLYNRMDHQMAIRTKYPFKRSSRMKIQMSAEEFKDALGESVKGVLSDGDEEVAASIPTYTLKHGEFSDEDCKRIMRLIQQMIDEWERINERTLSVEIKAGLREVPFPFWPRHKPAKWSWVELKKFLAYHYDLLWFWCDRDFDVNETPETILLEIVKQWIHRGGRGHLVFIPWTALRNHSAGLAMGHVVHGRAMRTSFPISGAKMTDAVKHRDDERCNMSIESRLENYLKADYAMDDYDAIVADLTGKVFRDGECLWYKSPEEPLAEVKFKISTNPLAAKMRSNKLLDTLSTEVDDDDELQAVDADDLVDDFDETAEDAMTALD